MTLSKKNKLSKNSFNKKGKLFSSKHLSFKLLSDKNKKFSVIISSKNINKANKRNLIRRRVQEIIKKTNSPKSGIFYIKKGAEKLSFKEMKKEVLTLLKS